MDAYIYQADIYCEDCAADIQRRIDTHERPEYPVCWSGDSDVFPDGPHPNGGGEADTPQHCGGCRVFLNNPLTPDGIKYVYEKIDDCLNGLSGTPSILAVWAETYRDGMTYFKEAPGDNNCNTDMAWRNVIQTLKEMSDQQT